MEAVCHGKQWDVALAHAPDGSIAAAMPYLLGSRCGMHYVLQPQLTQYNGPWLRPGCDQTAALQSLHDQLRRHHLLFFAQNFSPQSSNLPQWDGYDYSQRITYRIEDITDPVTVFQGFDKQRRQRPIRRAEKTLTPFYDLTPEDFALFHADYWASRGEKDLLSYEFIVRIVNAALSRQQGLLLGLKDPDGRLHAARFVVFDNRCAYSLLSALNPSGHHNGASPLLFWHIIQQLASRTKAFDFEGSMDPSIAFSYSLYGATPTTYPHVTRFCNPIVKKLLQHKI